MPKLYITSVDGTKHELTAEVGQTVMQVATDNNIDGIVAECGGNCVCATCHCFVSDDWTAKVGGPSDNEDMMLSMVDLRKEGSRLSCQIKITEEFDGLEIELPESQY
jgi:2Fe-2S ferredoxin